MRFMENEEIWKRHFCHLIFEQLLKYFWPSRSKENLPSEWRPSNFLSYLKSFQNSAMDGDLELLPVSYFLCMLKKFNAHKASFLHYYYSFILAIHSLCAHYENVLLRYMYKLRQTTLRTYVHSYFYHFKKLYSKALTQ